MTYDDLEDSDEYASPVTLFLFRYGEGPSHYYAYTNAEQPIIFNTLIPDLGVVTFDPITVTHGNIRSSGSLDKSQLEIRTPIDTALASLFHRVPPGSVVNLTIFDGHAGETEFKVKWVGRVLGVASRGREKSYTCEPVQTSLKTPGLRRNWQLGCPLPLYGPACRADEAAASTIYTVATVVGAIITLDATWAANPNQVDYLGGYVTYDRDGLDERRAIIRQAGGGIVIQGFAEGLVVGEQIRLTKGCSRSLDDCKRIHNNVPNYGGQPWIPLENPTGVKNIFY